MVINILEYSAYTDNGAVSQNPLLQSAVYLGRNLVLLESCSDITSMSREGNNPFPWVDGFEIDQDNDTYKDLWQHLHCLQLQNQLSGFQGSAFLPIRETVMLPRPVPKLIALWVDTNYWSLINGLWRHLPGRNTLDFHLLEDLGWTVC